MNWILTAKPLFAFAVLVTVWPHSNPAQAQAIKVIREPQKLTGSWHQDL
jgi:hypothetical protein